MSYVVVIDVQNFDYIRLTCDLIFVGDINLQIIKLVTRVNITDLELQLYFPAYFTFWRLNYKYSVALWNYNPAELYIIRLITNFAPILFLTLFNFWH